MIKRDLLSLCGSMEQIAGVRQVEYQDGRAAIVRLEQECRQLIKENEYV